MNASNLASVAVWLVAAAGVALGQIRFTDITADAGLLPHVQGALNHAVAWGDIDGDGRLDLFLGNFDKGPNPTYGLTEALPNMILLQGADGMFSRIPLPSVETRGRTSGAVLADLDNDGDLDLYVSNNTHPPGQRNATPATIQPSALYRNDGGRFVEVSRESGAVAEDAYYGRDIGVFDYDTDGLLDLLVLEDNIFRPAGRTRLLKNTGELRFQDVTREAGLPPDMDGLGVAVADLNGDDRPDFFICSANRLFLSQPGNTFREATSLRELLGHNPATREDMLTSAFFGDIDLDEDMDLLTGTHHVPSRIRVYLNDGLRDGIPALRDVTRELGLPDLLPNKAANCQVADFDHDGLPDLYWSAWFAEANRRQPFICRGLGVRDGSPRFDVPTVAGIEPNPRNIVPARGKTMVYYVNGPAVDYDNDGDLDIFAGIWPDENSRLFRNDTADAGNWLKVRVQGVRMNRMGIGAKVRFLADGKLLGCDELSMNGGYSGSRPPVAHFGLGTRDKVDVVVHFPGRGQMLKLEQVQANQTLVLREPAG